MDELTLIISNGNSAGREKVKRRQLLFVHANEYK
jgi:hypothetical protein